MNRYVFDTNTLVSALLFDQSVPGQAFHAALDRGTILLSYATFVELSRVLGRRKFDPYVTHDERDQFLVMLLQEAMLLDISEEVRACHDASDDKFLEVIVNGNASCLVSGDQDLLSVQRNPGA